MKILLDGDEVSIKVGDWVSTCSGVEGMIIKIDDLSEMVLVGKERAFGKWVNAVNITGLESNGGYSSNLSNILDSNQSDKALKEHSKNGIDKPQLSLIPQHALIEVAKVFMYGARKYDAYNYCKGEKNTVYIDACMRHINQYLLNQDNDNESGLLHLAHGVANLMMIIDNTIIGTNIEGRNAAYKI